MMYLLERIEELVQNLKMTDTPFLNGITGLIFSINNCYLRGKNPSKQIEAKVCDILGVATQFFEASLFIKEPTFLKIQFTYLADKLNSDLGFD